MHSLKLINVDTDAILVQKENGDIWTRDEQYDFLKELNDQFPDKIKFDHDGYFDNVIVLKAKNYILKENGSNKVKVKGSAFKSATKEPAVTQLMQDIVNAILEDKMDTLVSIYEKYVEEAMNIQDISRWCAKKTITEPVLNCEGYEKYTKEELKQKEIRTNEIVVWDAVKNEELIQQGDKVFVYPTVEISSITYKFHKPKQTKKEHIQKVKYKANYEYGLKLSKYWDKDKPNHDKQQLLKRLYDTMKIFQTILDINMFKNYALESNYKKLLLK